MIIEDDRFITQVYSTKLKEVGFDLAMIDGRTGRRAGNSQ